MNATSLHAQRGLSPWGLMIVIVIAGFFLLLAARLGPIYITNFSVQSTVKSLQNEPELANKSVMEIRTAVERKFDVNRVEVIQAVCRDKKKDCLKVEKTTDKLSISANYEARVHILANVDAVVVFNNNFVELPLKGGT